MTKLFISLTTICLLFLVISCSMFAKHDWEFNIRDHASKMDAHFVKANFEPYHYKILIVGQLNKEAKFLLNIVYPQPSKEYEEAKNEGHLQSSEFFLPKGKINMEIGGDLYTDELNLIYIPFKDSTYGNLKVKVSIN